MTVLIQAGNHKHDPSVADAWQMWRVGLVSTEPENDRTERMTTAPAMPESTPTVNAVVIRSSAGFERPALKPNEIKALASLKKDENNPCNT